MNEIWLWRRASATSARSGLCAGPEGARLDRDKIDKTNIYAQGFRFMRRFLTIVTIGLVFGLLPDARAQDAAYPSKPVRLVAAAAPGGNPDVLARLLSQKLADAFGKPFVVENVPSAGGVVAAKQVAAAPADGHVLMLGDSGALAINVAINPDVGYDPLKDFTPITALATVPTVLVIVPSLPAQDLQQFIDLARSKGGQMSY